MVTKGTKNRAPKGMAKDIVAKAMAAHPQWNARQISENYPVGKSTVHKHMKNILDKKDEPRRIREQAKSEERELSIKLQARGNKPKPNLTVSQRYKESDVRLAVISGFALGIIFTITAAAVAGVI